MSNIANQSSLKHWVGVCPSPMKPSPPSGRRTSPRGAGVRSGDSGSEIAPRSDPCPAAESPVRLHGPFSLMGQTTQKKQFKKQNNHTVWF